MENDDVIAQYLRENHCGEQNVVTSRILEEIFKMRGPELRRIINRLRSKCIPICSTDSGYFYAETEDELQRTIRQLRSRMTKIASAERGLTRSLSLFADDRQTSFLLEGGVCS